MQYKTGKRIGISTIGILLNAKDVSLVKAFGTDEVEFVMEFNEKGIIDGAFEKSLHASHRYTNLAALNDSALEFSKHEVSKLFQFGLPVVVHEGKSVTNFDGWKGKSFKRMEKALLDLSEAGNILLENITPSSYFENIAEFFAFASANNLNVCLDFSHVFANEGTLKNVFLLKDSHKERIKKFHISGTVPFKDRHFSIKEGAMPLLEIKAFLKEFSVPLINEAVFREGDIVEFYRNEIKLTREIYE